jgi:thiamine pyrophosphokinase
MGNNGGRNGDSGGGGIGNGRLGIAFIGGEGPTAALARSVAEEALAVSGSLVVAADSGLIAAEAAGIKPDWIVGDMDSLDSEDRLRKYPAERVLRYPGDKDYTDTELALSLLWDKGCDSVWLIGGGGGRLDHLLALRSLFERDRFPCRWLTACDDIRCIEGPMVLSLARKQGELLSVFPLGAGPWKVISCGLKWPLNDLGWDRGFFGISNVAEGEVTIQAESGRFLVVTPGA